MKKLPMIRAERGRSHHAKRKFPKLLFPRCESNEEIMHRSILKLGFVRIRFQPQIRHSDTRTYAGYHGAAITTDLLSINEARELVERVQATVRQFAEELGLAAPETSRAQAG